MPGSVRPYRRKLEIADKIITELFAKLTIIYQQKFTKPLEGEAILNATMHEWGLELSEFTGHHIGYALSICTDEHPVWPPTIGEFKQLCRLADIEPDYQPLMIGNPTKPETLEKSIEEMKEILK